MFQDLDCKKTGILNSNNLNIKGISEKQLEIFSEIIIKLQHTKASIRLEEFVDKALLIWEKLDFEKKIGVLDSCLLYTSPSPRD